MFAFQQRHASLRVLEDGARLVRLDALRHHVEDVVHHRRAQLEVKVGLDALLRYRFGDALGVPALKLSREQVSEPTLEERHNTTQEEEPHAPARCPEATPRALAHGTGVETVVDEVLQVLAHPDLSHQPVLVAVHARELADVRKDVLKSVGELECIDVAQPVLHDGVDNQLGQPQDLARQVERVAEARLFALLGRQRLDRLEVEVVVEVQVVEVLAVDEQVEHVVPLAAHLQPHLDPVELGALEELGCLERLEKVLLVQRLGRAVVQLVEHPALEELLVAHAHLDRVVRRAALVEPAVHERHVQCAAHSSLAQVERARRPVHADARRGVVRVQRPLLEETARRLPGESAHRRHRRRRTRPARRAVPTACEGESG